MENELDYYLSDAFRKLTHQQQRFCDNYLTHFNAFKAAVDAGYSENTSRKGALLHVPKIQQYLQERMAERSKRLEITHDMLLRELSKIAFSNMGNYYDEHACLKKVNELTVDEKAAIAFYDIIDVQDADGHYIGTRSKIKLHNKMAALDRIARHVGFYGVVGRSLESGVLSPESGVLSRGPGFTKHASKGADVKKLVVVDRSTDDLPMDYPVEDFDPDSYREAGIDLKTLAALEGVDAGPGYCWRDVEDEGFEEVAGAVAVALSPESGVFSRESGSLEDGIFAGGLKPEVVGNPDRYRDTSEELLEENRENILTISPPADKESRGKIQESR